YRRYFRDRLYQAFRPARLDWGKGRRGTNRNGKAPPAAQRPPRIDPALLRSRNAEIRLALLINFPFLLDEHVEDAAASRCPDRELDRLLHEILRIHAQNPDLDAATLKFHLTENGFGTVVDRVFSPQVLNHAASARPGADPEIVREAWSELARQIEQSEEARDV